MFPKPLCSIARKYNKHFDGGKTSEKIGQLEVISKLDLPQQQTFRLLLVIYTFLLSIWAPSVNCVLFSCKLPPRQNPMGATVISESVRTSPRHKELKLLTVLPADIVRRLCQFLPEILRSRRKLPALVRKTQRGIQLSCKIDALRIDLWYNRHGSAYAVSAQIDALNSTNYFS